MPASPDKILTLSGQLILIVQFVPVIFGFIYRRQLDRPLRVFWYYSIVGLLAELLIQLFIWDVNHTQYSMPMVKWLGVTDTNFTNILSQLNTFGLMGWFFYLALGDHALAKPVKYLSIFLFFGALINYLFIEGYKAFGVFNPTADAVFSFSIPLLLMWTLYQTESKVALNRNPYFWIYLRLIVPNLLGLFLYFTGDYLHRNDYPLYVNVVVVSNVFYLVGFCFAAYGFYLSKNVRFLR
jgi:hypothetical protein